MQDIKINDRIIGKSNPSFIIAEAGVNHNGSIEQAKKLIAAAKVVGADAIKFQTFKAEKVVTKYAETARYQKEECSHGTQYDLLKGLELTNEEFNELFEYAKKVKITLLSSPFDVESADFLYNLGVPVFKIASGEITNYPLLKRVAEKGKPVILSTGMSTFIEIEEALKVFQNAGLADIILLHCVTSYPADATSINLGMMSLLRERFGLPTGFSDHTVGILIPVAAAALGAVVIEKHFTLNKMLDGPDHKASLEPEEFNEMVKSIRLVEGALGASIERSKDEEAIKVLVRRSIVASEPILKGSIISERMITFKRPGIGISPMLMERVIGKKAKTDIAIDELIIFDNIM